MHNQYNRVGNPYEVGQVQFDRSPWPLFPFLAQTDKRLAIEPNIRTDGCAFMICCAIGHLFSRPCITAQYNEHQKPQDVLYLARHAQEEGALRADFFINDWQKMIDLAIGESGLVKYLGHEKNTLKVFDSRHIIIQRWERSDKNVGSHFVFQYRSRMLDINYDPLDSAYSALGNSLSWTRKLGDLMDLRVFKILG